MVEQAPPPKDPEMALSTKSPPALRPVPITPDLDPPGADRLGLSRAEIEQFKTQGFVVKRGLIPRSTFKPFIDLWWRQPPVTAAGLSRDQGGWSAPGEHWPTDNRWGLADNWMGAGAWPSPEDERPGATVGERVGRLPYKLTRDRSNDVWRWHGIGHDPAFVAATSAHPRMLYMLEALLGGPVKRPRRNRGIYAVFPRDPEAPASRLGPHMDQSMTELSAVTYLEDVPPNSGGFTIYPTSPQLLYPTSAQALNWVATEQSAEVIDHIKTNVQPLELTGKAGDVIFCHGWIVHSAGIHETDRIRMAAVQDFNKVRERSHMRWTAAGKNGGPRINCDMDGVFRFSEESEDDPADGHREVTNQWIMDSNEFVLARSEPFDDMFREWNLGRHPVAGDIVDEPAWWEKYNLPLLPTGGMPRGTGGTPAVALSDIAEYGGDGTWTVQSRANDWRGT
ncbi:MAG: phytanoyl-CoA dioxygenase family protein [Gammaproteobacteria bacterium]|nr:phytanoyl-CoA dioxygenase family protein [Gammaproteobacteria bacterium]